MAGMEESRVSPREEQDTRLQTERLFGAKKTSEVVGHPQIKVWPWRNEALSYHALLNKDDLGIVVWFGRERVLGNRWSCVLGSNVFSSPGLDIEVRVGGKWKSLKEEKIPVGGESKSLGDGIDMMRSRRPSWASGRNGDKIQELQGLGEFVLEVPDSRNLEMRFRHKENEMIVEYNRVTGVVLLNEPEKW